METYTIQDLRRELQGVKMGDRMLSAQIVQSLSTAQALEWYYRTHIPDLGNVSPHDYVEKNGVERKERLANEIYYLLVGQPD